MRPAALERDLRRLRALQATLRAVKSAQVSKAPPIIDWRHLSDRPEINSIATAGLRSAVKDVLPPASMKLAVLAWLEAEIEEIKARYPMITLEED